MEVSLTVDRATCIKCGRCVKVCPAGIFDREAVGADIELHNVGHCIVCGHCVAACPTASVKHSSFPPERVHLIERKELPDPQSMLLLCRARRSNRAFTNEPIPHEYLDMILEAAHRAPTASNKQQVGFTLVTSKDKLAEVSQFTIDSFGAIAKVVGNPLVKPVMKIAMPEVVSMLGRFRDMRDEHEKGNDPILRGATALLLIHTPADSRFGRDDANLAYQNGSLMAESLGVSQFYTGFVCTAIRRDRKNRMEELFGIDGKIQVGMALGMPAFIFPNYIDKKDIEVSRFE